MRKIIFLLMLSATLFGCKDDGGDKLVLDKNDWQCAGASRVQNSEGQVVDECNMYIKRSAWRR